jgi:hypothetical protein
MLRIGQRLGFVRVDMIDPTPEPIPAEELLGMSLMDGWQVVARFARPEEATGGNFSVAYRVERPAESGLEPETERAFLKALDYSQADKLGLPFGFVNQKWPHRDGLIWPHLLARCGNSRHRRTRGVTGCSCRLGCCGQLMGDSFPATDVGVFRLQRGSGDGGRALDLLRVVRSVGVEGHAPGLGMGAVAASGCFGGDAELLADLRP